MRVQLRSVKQQAMEAEVTQLLRFFTRKRLVKTLQKHDYCGELFSNKDY
jgi:hypothetical protein